LVAGRRPLAVGRWLLATGCQSLASGPGPLASGGGRWLLAWPLVAPLPVDHRSPAFVQRHLAAGRRPPLHRPRKSGNTIKGDTRLANWQLQTAGLERTGNLTVNR